MNNKEIGNRIKSRRKELNFTLKEIADIVGVASSTIQRYESGYISQYKLPVLESIAKAINVNPTWLVREDAPMETGIPDNDFIKVSKEFLKKTEPLTVTIKVSDFLNNDKDKKDTSKLSDDKIKLIEAYDKLNDLGKKEAIKRVEELTYIDRYNKKDYLTPVAAHAKDNYTEEDIKHDLDMMNDENW